MARKAHIVAVSCPASFFRSSSFAHLIKPFQRPRSRGQLICWVPTLFLRFYRSLSSRARAHFSRNLHLRTRRFRYCTARGRGPAGNVNWTECCTVALGLLRVFGLNIAFGVVNFSTLGGMELLRFGFHYTWIYGFCKKYVKLCSVFMEREMKDCARLIEISRTPKYSM